MRLRTLIVFGAGYIWGARSGHDRLLELADRARDLLSSDLVRDYVQRMQTARVGDELTGSEESGEEPEEFDEEPEELDESEDFDEAEEAEDVDEEPEEVEDENEEPQPARSHVRRRAPGRARR
jgi:hypothetical protein